MKWVMLANILVDLAIIGVAVFLTVHFNNGKWMWLLAFILVTGWSTKGGKE